jgi:hypothetical protein
VRALQAEGDADPDVISATMDDFRSAADSGSEKLFTSYQADGNQADITAVRDFTSAQMADVAEMTTSANTVTNDLLLSAADTLADIDAQARGLCGACQPTAPLTTPQALSAGAGAASFANLLASPVSQVKTEAATIAAARAARIHALQQVAQHQADTLPVLPTGTKADGTPDYSLPSTPGSSENPLTNVVTPDGKLLPTVTSGAAVKDLVSGVTSTVSTATGGATDPLTKPLDDTVKQLGDTVGKATGDLDLLP